MSIKKRIPAAAQGIPVAADVSARQCAALSAVIAVFVACTAVNVFTYLVPSVSYGQLSAIKWGIIAAAVAIWLAVSGQRPAIRSWFTPQKIRHEFLPGLLLGAAALIIMLLGAFIAVKCFDTSALQKEMVASRFAGRGLAFKGIYILIVNTILEEILFRGLLYFTVCCAGNRGLARVVSSALFAYYHIYMFYNLKTVAVAVLAAVGLFLAGLVLCRMNEKSQTLFNGWIAHAMGIVSIFVTAFYLFGYFKI